MNELKKNQSKEEAFVDYIIQLWQADSGAGAALKRADNPDTEYQSWEILAKFVDLENKHQRLPYALIGAALARGKVESSGKDGIGTALARCYEDGRENDQAKAKMRRLLACENVQEACRVVRSILRLMESKGKMNQLDWARLLRDLVYFGERTKIRWTKDFYYGTSEGKNENMPEKEVKS